MPTGVFKINYLQIDGCTYDRVARKLLKQQSLFRSGFRSSLPIRKDEDNNNFSSINKTFTFGFYDFFAKMVTVSS